MFRPSYESQFSWYGPPVPSSLLEIVEQWTAEDVASWLRGLDDCVLPFVHFLVNRGVDGVTLLMLTHGDLKDMGISSLGVRQTVLQAIDLLVHLCYGVESENVQRLCLCCGVRARNLLNDVRAVRRRRFVAREQVVSALNTLFSGVSYLVEETRRLISWLDRSPFDNLHTYMEIRQTVMDLIVKVLDCTQIPSADILKATANLEVLCHEISAVCDQAVQTNSDPLILQTAYLDRAVLRRAKPDQELGINLWTTYRGVHTISEVRFQSPADLCGKVDAGDEILQINGQTVVGWDLRKMVAALSQQRSGEVAILLKKRPRGLAPRFGNKSLPGTPKMAPKRQLVQQQTEPNLLKPAAANSSLRLETGSCSSAAEFSPSPEPEPGDFVAPRGEERRKQRLQSSSYTELTQRKEKRKSRKQSNETSGAKEINRPLVFDSFVSDSDDDADEMSPVIRQRRATVSGGSPTLKRLSLHINRKSSACPRPQSHWNDLVPGLPGGASKFVGQADTGLAPRGDAIRRNNRLTKQPHVLRPSSFINDQVVAPPRRLTTSTESSTDDQVTPLAAPDDDDDDAVFLPWDFRKGTVPNEVL